MSIEDISLPDGRVWIHQIDDTLRPNLRIRNVKLGACIFRILESYRLASDNYCITVQKDWSKNGIGFRVTYQKANIWRVFA